MEKTEQTQQAEENTANIYIINKIINFLRETIVSLKIFRNREFLNI